MSCLLIDYKPQAQKRLPAQFKDKPKLTGFINSFIDDDLVKAECDVINKRGLNTAEGKQLDGIGEIVGKLRPREAVSDDDDFGFEDDDSARGFADTANPDNGGYLGSAFPQLSGLVDDDIYRLLIKTKIFQNSSNMTVDETLNILSVLFDAKITYNGKLNLYPIYEIGKEFFSFERDIINSLPQLIGIGQVRYVTYPKDEGFGFEDDDDALGFADTVNSENGGYLASLV